jgi:GNAT superfamily N-acetyltransferase
MRLQFTTPFQQKPGTVAWLLKQSYRDLLERDSSHWKSEEQCWEQYDQEVYQQPETVGACIFLSQLKDSVVGFASWDPRQRPQYGIVGHNCILPEFRGKGLGKQQIQEVLRRFRQMGIQTAKVSTNDHPFFVAAQCMYGACWFREIRRVSWDRDPKQKIVEYEKEIV